METMTIRDKKKAIEREPLLIDLNKLTDGEKVEMKKLGILSKENSIVESVYPEVHAERPPIEKFVTHAPHTINEAYNYEKPSSFSRARMSESSARVYFCLPSQYAAASLSSSHSPFSSRYRSRFMNLVDFSPFALISIR